MPAQNFILMVSSEKVTSYVSLVEAMLRICVMKGSKETIALYRKLVGRYFNAFLAANLVSLGARESLANMSVEDILRASKETAYSQMTEFCRGVF